MVLYNAFLAVVIVCVCYVIGEWVADLSKAWMRALAVSLLRAPVNFSLPTTPRN